MLDSTHTWTAAYKYYDRLPVESQAVFESIQFDNQDTDLFAWLNSQLIAHNNLLDNPVQFNQWFESTYDFKNMILSVKEVAPPATVEQFIESLEEDTVQKMYSSLDTVDAPGVHLVYSKWESFMDTLQTLTPDEQYIVMMQLGFSSLNKEDIQMPSDKATGYRTYLRRVKALESKFRSL